ncbi:MAG: RcnB family protein, partial [Pseudomonadota bacterium]|nr:RcnB family protein [Pseudomonadota bacterium]
RERANRPGSSYPDAWQGDPNDPRRRHYEELERRNQWRYGTREQREEIREERRDWRNDHRDDRDDEWRNDDRRDDRNEWRRDWRDERRDWRRDWNRDWRYDNRYDWSGWRYRNRNAFRGPRYYAPYRNHRYSRFGIGFFLEPHFYSQRYWIGDPWYYRLPPAPLGTQWVRYYNDVLLVDTWSGEVIDVIYDFFW